MIFNLENFMANLSFCLLFFTMLSYWICAGLATNSTLNRIGTIGMLFSNLSLLILLLIRWKESGHFPLSNLYESLLFLSWSLTFFNLILEKINQTDFSIIGAITAPSALLTTTFATFSLPVEMQKASALVPALQSNWLIMHVTIMILSYAALIFGCLLSVAFLILTRNEEIDLSGNSFGNFFKSSAKIENSFLVIKNQKVLDDSNADENNVFLSENLVYQTENSNLENLQPKINYTFSSHNLAKNLDNLSYRILGLGFPLLTIGILSGSVWANEAWGSYWSWDPKETWALLTWFVFAIYLHTRLTKGWQGKKPAIIASFGFVIVWVCFIGVNLLGKGLHSYGWVRFF
uniref:Cytochrome c biogenesis protein CcsA n=1 Tax=Aphanochaete confervicola TaxID=764104 RepID=A0A6H1XE19_9CHLO|nr:heme attachment to plastid cytochrome c [Aphanochaete confervicola]QJA13901.1 heme attachment to plastid cytochrome c [Aphanochaete confervicola]